MPVKRRVSKRRDLTDTALLEAWRTTFECGHDFFGDLGPLGIVESPLVSSAEKREKARAAFISKAHEAWEQLGAAYLDEWQPTVVREQPWALEQFGEPNAR